MRQKIALLLALALICACGAASADSFTPITVDGSDYIANIDNCIAAIDQTTLGAGEVFSFNEVVGERSEARGYRSAPNGRGVDVVGGGVGQVATTIYLAVKHDGDLEVLEKETYGSDFCGGYAPDESDAVLADWAQGLDFRFVNNGGDATIRLWRDGQSLHCSIEPAQ